MKLLAVDTSTTSCSVALFASDRLLAETTYTAGKTHSRHLLSLIHGILRRCDCPPAALGAIAVTRGPGTFTGLRIGLATVKGLAVATRAPVVGICSLSALAFPFSGDDRPVVAMIDARRKEVYHARYGGDAGEAATVIASVDPPEAVAAEIPEGAVLVGSGALLYRDLFQTRCRRPRIPDATQHLIRAASVGRLALMRILDRGYDPVGRLAPEYIRQSDAQIRMSASC